MTELEVPDPDLPGESAVGAQSGDPPAPYGSLFVPLIVVPAAIVITLVLVFVLFGAIAGDEASPSENLERLVGGGANERQQAAFNLVRQAMETWQSREEGSRPDWDFGADFFPEVRAAWDGADPQDFEQRYVLAILLALLGDPQAHEHLESMLEISEAEDPEGVMQVYILTSLGRLGDARAARSVIEFLQHEDSGIRHAAAAALQNLDSPLSRPALRELLGDPELDLRGQAALSLAYLGDAGGVGVLHELLGMEAYERERDLFPGRWRRGSDVHNARLRALQSLWRLGRPEDLARIETMSLEEGDLELRAAALAALPRWGEGPGPVGGN